MRRDPRAGHNPIAGVNLWRPVMERADYRCQCSGGCGKTHAKEPDGRCKREHRGDTLLVASPRMPTGNPLKDRQGEQVAYCPSCYDGHRRAYNREQKAIETPREPLFGEDGSVPEEPAQAVPPPALDLIKVPHGHGGDAEADARYTIEEAMRLSDGAGSGRIKFAPGSKLAFWSLLAQGWTPPGDGGDDEAARLRAALAGMQQRLDEVNAYSARMHEAEQEADNRRASMAITLNNSVYSLRELAKVAKSKGEPEPTLPVTKVAAALEKALARNRR